MNNIQLQPGLYTNIFPVTLPEEAVTIMVIKRTQVVDLRALRTDIEGQKANVFVYAHKNCVYGYGQDAIAFLAGKDFQEDKIFLRDIPALAAHVVMDGLILSALSKGFWQREKNSPKGFEARAKIFHPSPKGVTSQGKVKVFAGYDLRCAHYPAVESLGLVVDVVWAYQDEQGNPLNMHQMRIKNALNEALVIQEEFLRSTRTKTQEEFLRSTMRFNLQISQMRMHDYLLPFAQEFHEFTLPCGGQAQLGSIPFRVILGR
ncbi:hypothetical protein SE15_06655 [Thermanaerothrix daxensis]|uniref:Uncharacterized protein n=1 Tax=Thermanaerothrix daxensis TaxID=869279 RepID=A0A0P6Y7B2_9CHLR|nr:hypothetical protein [Thermanaerothrix daxensis]KPL84705.1 hypothetical protein SE15_06655 [Thermanaerothrix daxensis]